MAKNTGRQDLEITLSRLEVAGRKRHRRAVHQLEAALLWPRVGIAQRSASCQLVLEQGICDFSGLPWFRRVLFKETCSDEFALCLELSISLKRSLLRSAPRRLFGYIFKTAGDYADDLGPAGEVAEQPLKEISRALLDKNDAAAMGWGAVDLKAADFADGLPHEVTVELSSGDGSPSARAPKVIGKAVLQVRALL
ncbi:MAG: hypothetical protein J6S21_06410 [Victivallales bacterium]|nr:hypothetical protein [Victivallales bacterium]